MNARTETKVRAHGEMLIAAYNATESDPIKLCRKLRRAEVFCHRQAERYCNGEIDGTDFDWLTIPVEVAILRLLPNVSGFFINSDPRGYALKTEPCVTPDAMPRDWGGYGLIAPDLRD